MNTTIGIILIILVICFQGCSVKLDKSGEWKTKKSDMYHNDPDTFHVEIGEIWHPYLNENKMKSAMPEILKSAKATFTFLPIDGKDPATRRFSGIDFNLFTPGGGGMGGTSQGPTFHINTDLIEKTFTVPLKLHQENNTTILSCDFPKVKDPRYTLEDIVVKFNLENQELKDITKNLTLNFSDMNGTNNFYIHYFRISTLKENIEINGHEPIVSLKAYTQQHGLEKQFILTNDSIICEIPNGKIAAKYKKFPENISDIVSQRINIILPKEVKRWGQDKTNLEIVRLDRGNVSQITISDTLNGARSCNGFKLYSSETWVFNSREILHYTGSMEYLRNTYNGQIAYEQTPKTEMEERNFQKMRSYSWEINYNSGDTNNTYLNNKLYTKNKPFPDENTMDECSKKNMKDVISRLDQNKEAIENEGLYYLDLLNQMSSAELK